MPVSFTETVENIGKVVDAIGIAIVVIGSLAALLPYVVRSLMGQDQTTAYPEVRQNLGRAILLGLEFLVAGDIIRTVASSPTFTSVGVLGAIVIIRTLLSWALELEVSGDWPWRRGPEGRARPQ
jgi:uncharacterized membrane protein